MEPKVKIFRKLRDKQMYTIICIYNDNKFKFFSLLNYLTNYLGESHSKSCTI